MVVIWIGFNIHHVMVTSTIEEAIQLHLTPINGSFDTQTIQQTKSRIQVTPLYEKSGNIQPTPARTATTPAISAKPEPTTNPDRQITP